MENEKQVSIEQQIHNAVYSAQESILEEANRILNEKMSLTEKECERYLALKKMGFEKAKGVVEAEAIVKKNEELQKMKDAIAAFQVDYPFNKFIDHETVVAICNKYGLLLTFVRDYIDDIPENKQEEILAFRVKRKHTRKPVELYSMTQLLIGMHIFGEMRFRTDECRESYLNEKVVGSELLIMAPAHKLDIGDKEVEGVVVKNNDPIVLQPVTCGYLIVSSWGLEASDELVVNTINN